MYVVEPPETFAESSQVGIGAGVGYGVGRQMTSAWAEDMAHAQHSAMHIISYIRVCVRIHASLGRTLQVVSKAHLVIRTSPPEAIVSP